MHITKVREVIASIFCVVLIVALVIGILIALGKPVPLISDLLGR